MTDHPLIFWTARLVVGCYLLRYVVRAWTGGPATRLEAVIWLSGAVLLAVHVAGAFHFAHDWNHEAAVAHTAERTSEVVGIDWGGGVWFNYLAIVIWGVDALLMMCGSPPPSRAEVIRAVVVHGYLGLMMISATVLFGPSYWWIVAVGFVIVALTAGYRRRRMQHRP